MKSNSFKYKQLINEVVANSLEYERSLEESIMMLSNEYFALYGTKFTLVDSLMGCKKTIEEFKEDCICAIREKVNGTSLKIV